jgi:hypothetical protein
MSELWWVALVVAVVAVGALCWMARLVAREVAALSASTAGLSELRTGLATVDAEIAGTRRAVECLDLR